jgi:hypothetical protein
MFPNGDFSMNEDFERLITEIRLLREEIRNLRIPPRSSSIRHDVYGHEPVSACGFPFRSTSVPEIPERPFEPTCIAGNGLHPEESIGSLQNVSLEHLR